MFSRSSILVLVIAKYCCNENIKASAAEIKEEVKNNAAKYGMKDEEFLDAMGGNDAIAYDIKMKKAVEIIKEA